MPNPAVCICNLVQILQYYLSSSLYIMFGKYLTNCILIDGCVSVPVVELHMVHLRDREMIPVAIFAYLPSFFAVFVPDFPHKNLLDNCDRLETFFAHNFNKFQKYRLSCARWVAGISRYEDLCRVYKISLSWYKVILFI